MSIYAISDLHLSLASSKPMNIFGPAWENHADKIRRNWELVVREEDTVLLPGDLSWAMRLSEARPDLEYLASLPGKKILIRGNHDYWWQRSATSRMQRTLDRSLVFLQGTSEVVGNVGITGTRGWRVDWDVRGDERSTFNVQHPTSNIQHPNPNTEHSDADRVLHRELSYLEKGLRSIPDSVETKIVMLHFPPFDEKLRPNEFARLLAAFEVDILVYGHIHLGLGNWLEGLAENIQYRLVSADIVDFTPQLILP